jgi:hypothetical protein
VSRDARRASENRSGGEAAAEARSVPLTPSGGCGTGVHNSKEPFTTKSHLTRITRITTDRDRRVKADCATPRDKHEDRDRRGVLDD